MFPTHVRHYFIQSVFIFTLAFTIVFILHSFFCISVVSPETILILQVQPNFIFIEVWTNFCLSENVSTHAEYRIDSFINCLFGGLLCARTHSRHLEQLSEQNSETSHSCGPCTLEEWVGRINKIDKSSILYMKVKSHVKKKSRTG